VVDERDNGSFGWDVEYETWGPELLKKEVGKSVNDEKCESQGEDWNDPHIIKTEWCWRRPPIKQ
jgi:hypothetical protein